MLLIAIGIAIGVFVSLRNIFLNRPTEEIVEVLEEEIYIDELNLPLIEVDTLNPILTKNKQVADVLKLIYEPLFDLNEVNELEPKLANEWNEKDSNTWIIKLNSLVTWHSDKYFSADDVIFTYNAILTSKDSVYKENIKNIISMEKLDDNAIQINLAEEDKLLLYKLTFPIIPEYYFKDDLYNEWKAIRAVGTGPYQYNSMSEDEKIILLVSNAKWWKKEEFKLNKIYLYNYSTYGEAIKAFKSTEIDVIPTTMSSWQKKFGAIGINSYLYESDKFETIIANTQIVPLNESSVRRMILAGINSENIIESIYDGNGRVRDCPINFKSYLNFDDNSKKYDIEKAKQLLINAGWNNATGIWQKEINHKKYVLAFELLVNSDNEEKVEIANLVVANLKEIGVKLKVVKVNAKEYNKRIANGNFELALATINLNMDIDIMELLESTSEKNFAKYKNIEMDAIIHKINQDNLQEKLKQLQELYRNEAPYIGLYYKCNNLLTNKSVKGNINPTSWNVYHGITGWCK